MTDGRDASPKRPGGAAKSGASLKLYGCVTAFFYALSLSVFQRGLIGTGNYTAQELSELMSTDGRVMMLSGWASVLQLVGNLSVPVFAFLLVEGFYHTGSLKKYLLRMAFFGMLSEVPYDLALYGRPWDLTGQNVFFTYFVCLVMLWSFSYFQNRQGFMLWAMRLAAVLAAAVWVSVMRSCFGLITVALCAVYALLREKRGQAILIGAAVSVAYISAPVSAFPLWNYAGARGRTWNKFIYYALYPAHLLLLWAVTLAVTGM